MIGNLFVKVCKLNYVIISNNLNILYYEHVNRQRYLEWIASSTKLRFSQFDEIYSLHIKQAEVGVIYAGILVKDLQEKSKIPW